MTTYEDAIRHSMKSGAEAAKASTDNRMRIALAKQEFKADRVMTKEEYDAMPLIGWHEVCKDFDGFGNVGVRFRAALQRS